MKPLNDKLKVKVAKDEFGFGGQATGVEKGIVVEVPDKMAYFGFHSFAFENSIANDEILKKTLAAYTKLKGKLVFWEALQDRGRRFKENDEEFVFINMTDIIAYADDINLSVEAVNQVGSAGSFNLE
jgi:co-chaperonin GroES (HSP10)